MNEWIRKLNLPALAKRRVTWALAAVVLLGAILALASLGGGGATQHLSAKVQKGEIRDEVEATGTVSAVITVQVGSQVSGTIAKLNADFNSRVHKGDVIALIIILVTHEPDIAQFTKRMMIFKDGSIRKDEPVKEGPSAQDVLKTLPTLED